MAKEAEEKSCFGGGGQAVFIGRENGLRIRQKGGLFAGDAKFWESLGIVWRVCRWV